MIKVLKKRGAYFFQNQVLVEDKNALSIEYINSQLRKKNLPEIQSAAIDKEQAKSGTIAYQILQAHNTAKDMSRLKLKYDALASHDITYVGIIQTARASGLKEFPVPYVLTNCHNSLSAVGGTINEDDHRFGLSAAKKYGGIFVPPHQAVIHQYVREMLAGCGKMILGSDSHTRYGALGTLAVGEGGPELVKQLLGHTYEVQYPGVIAVYLKGKPAIGVGPQDIAIALITAVFKSGYATNKVLEFIGPGVHNLTVDYRNGIDVMTTETTCLSSIWCTDKKVEEFYKIHKREDAYKELKPAAVAYYDGLIKIDLSRIEPMIALPFHPSNGYPISQVNQNPGQFLELIEESARELIDQSKVELNFKKLLQNGRIKFHQGVVAGCAGGTFENILEMAKIMGSGTIGHDDFSLSVYPSSQPVSLELVRQGITARLMSTGVIVRSAFCGPCFGAGDTPANGTLSARHATRNFPNREGSKPGDRQLAAVALMDARSIAATALHNGALTAATEIEQRRINAKYKFDNALYETRVYAGFGKAEKDLPLQFGPSIRDWPAMIALPENLLLMLAAVIRDPVTTTDELIPSGETSAYRSDPMRLAEFTLSRKVPGYVKSAKEILKSEQARQQYLGGSEFEVTAYEKIISGFFALKTDEYKNSDLLFIKEQLKTTGIGTAIFAQKPGDGSAREQAASCQKVLGGWANLALEYATKRYRSNLINWGMLPFHIDAKDSKKLETGHFIYIPNIRELLSGAHEEIPALLIIDQKPHPLTLRLPGLSADERRIILAGCLINDYRQNINQ